MDVGGVQEAGGRAAFLCALRVQISMTRTTQPRERLYVEEWPPALSRAWRDAVHPSAMFDDSGLASGWSGTARQSVENGLGHYLGFLSRIGGVGSNTQVEQLCNPDWLRRYHRFCKERRLSPATIATRFNMLNEALRVMAPKMNRVRLVKGLRRLQATERAHRRKEIPPVSASDLYFAGIARMERVQDQGYQKRDVQAVQFGDGLMMTILALKPIRIRTLARMDVGQHLSRKGDRYVVSFSAGETKNAHPVYADLPIELTPFVEDWLKVYRPVLLGSSVTPAMWVSCYRDRMAAATIYMRFCASTFEELGHRINPHMVRSIVATSVSISIPSEARIIPSLLDHRTSTIARQHYIVADRLSASARYVAGLAVWRSAALAAERKGRGGV